MRHPHSADYWGRAARLAEIPLEVRKAAAERRMAAVDAQPLEWRLFIHEYGWRNAKIYMKLDFTPAKAAQSILRAREQRLREAEFACLADELILE